MFHHLSPRVAVLKPLCLITPETVEQISGPHERERERERTWKKHNFFQ
jgi:hypothetical protein